MTKLISFDCYGTLINWEKGMREALDGIVERHGKPAPWEALTARYVEVEMEVEARAYRPYRLVLSESLQKMFETFDIHLDEQEALAFVETIRKWEPFPEVRQALEAVRGMGKKLAILSNVDNDIIADSVKLIGVDFDTIITAEDVKSYKPATGHWERLLQETGLKKEEVLHVAASARHDIRPATEIGFTTVWVNRMDEPSDMCWPTHTLSDLAGLPELAL